MSLSFISKTIQTSRDDGGFDEQPVEVAGNDTGDKSSYTLQKPLFEQLRDNQEQEEAERAELQRSIMRGTLALDDEDCAHLDAIQKERLERMAAQQRQTEQELAAFRAAQADRLEDQVVVDRADEQEKTQTSRFVPEKRAASIILAAPRIVVKKRRLRNAEESGASKDGVSEVLPVDETNLENSHIKASGGETADTGDSANGGLGGLLSGYGSSENDD